MLQTVVATAILTALFFLLAVMLGGFVAAAATREAFAAACIPEDEDGDASTPAPAPAPAPAVYDTSTIPGSPTSATTSLLASGRIGASSMVAALPPTLRVPTGVASSDVVHALLDPSGSVCGGGCSGSKWRRAQVTAVPEGTNTANLQWVLSCAGPWSENGVAWTNLRRSPTAAEIDACAQRCATTAGGGGTISVGDCQISPQGSNHPCACRCATSTAPSTMTCDPTWNTYAVDAVALAALPPTPAPLAADNARDTTGACPAATDDSGAPCTSFCDSLPSRRERALCNSPAALQIAVAAIPKSRTLSSTATCKKTKSLRDAVCPPAQASPCPANVTSESACRLRSSKTCCVAAASCEWDDSRSPQCDRVTPLTCATPPRQKLTVDDLTQCGGDDDDGVATGGQLTLPEPPPMSALDF